MSAVRFKTPSAVTPARLDASDLDDHDLVQGIVLPQLEETLSSPEDMKREFSTEQAREIDLTALPTRMNHSSSLEPVGITLAYRVIDGGDGKPAQAETLHKLHREPDDGIAPDDPVAVLCSNQRDLLMTGVHSGLSLGHAFSTDFVADLGRYDASLSGQTGRIINKRPLEVSICKRGKRPGSEILEYLPCKRSLRRTIPEHIRMFCEKYRYTPPPAEIAADRNAPEWKNFIEHLWTEVQERRRAILSSQTYAESLRSRGVVAASSSSSFAAPPVVPWLSAESLLQPANMSSAPNNINPQAPQQQQQQAAAGGETSTPNIAGAVASETVAVRDVVPNQGAPLDPLEVASETQAVANRAIEAYNRMKAELEEYKAREATEQQSRKRKQEEDEAQAQKVFQEQKARKLEEYKAQGNKALQQGGVNADTVKVAVNNALAALEASKTLDDLKAAERVHDTSLVLLQQASASAAQARYAQQQAELLHQRRVTQQWASQLPPTGGIQTSGGSGPFGAPPQTPAIVPPTPDAGLFNASASSTSSFWPTGNGAGSGASGPVIHSPAVDYSAEDRFAQILKSHEEQRNQIPSLKQLLLGGERVEETVNMSATGPVKSVTCTPMLSEPLPLREYSWKTAAPEMFSQLTSAVQNILSGRQPRPELSAMEEMARNGSISRLDKITGVLPGDGFTVLRPLYN